MAKGKGKKRKQARAATAGPGGARPEGAAPRPAPAPAPAARKAAAPAPPARRARSFLRTLDDPRTERRYEPRTSFGAVLTVLGMSLGALAVGAGVYGQWLRPWTQKVAPLPFSFWLLGAGAAIFGLLAAVGAKQPLPARVGDAGVGVEKDDGTVERVAWCDVVAIHLGPEGATIESPVSTLAILAAHHPEALKDLVREAAERIDAKVDGELGPLGSGPAGEALELEPAQAMGQRCRASDRLISVEEDARLCGRCGELYHAKGVPPRCLSCDAVL